MIPQKAKENILVIAKRMRMESVVYSYGIEFLWNRIQEEAEDDIFTPISEICVDQLNILAVS